MRSNERGFQHSLRPGVVFQRPVRTVGVVYGRMKGCKRSSVVYATPPCISSSMAF